MAPYMQQAQIYICPADKMQIEFGNALVPKIRSYSMNGYLHGGIIGGGGQWAPPWPLDFMKRTSEFASPAQIFTLIDVEPASICYAPFVIPQYDAMPWFSAPGALHNNQAVISFADSHVETHRWRNPVNRVPKAVAGNPHSIPSDPDDVAYIRARAHNNVPSFAFPF